MKHRLGEEKLLVRMCDPFTSVGGQRQAKLSHATSFAIAIDSQGKRSLGPVTRLFPLELRSSTQ